METEELLKKEISSLEKEQEEFDANCSWNIIFQRLKNEASILAQDSSTNIARSPENRTRNRYRDVMPYDHSRVRLTSTTEGDYINASLVRVPVADDRRYLFTQGPLPNTAAHFWLMVWEQRSRIVVMLNRLIEKEVLKCAAYYPAGSINGDLDEKTFPEVGLRVLYLTEANHGFYIQRILRLQDMKSGESREVLHFHYLTWPDFGVPRSPGAFLNFLWAVRRSGGLDGPTDPNTGGEIGPPVVHCSAGIGRSGTFALVDCCLVLINRSGTLNGLDLRGLLLEMRRDRMGLIQTGEQLRFSYQAVIEGGSTLLDCVPELREELEFPMSQEDRQPPVEHKSDTESSSSGTEEDEMINLDDSDDDEDDLDLEDRRHHHHQLHHGQQGEGEGGPEGPIGGCGFEDAEEQAQLYRRFMQQQREELEEEETSWLMGAVGGSGSSRSRDSGLEEGEQLLMHTRQSRDSGLEEDAVSAASEGVVYRGANAGGGVVLGSTLVEWDGTEDAAVDRHPHGKNANEISIDSDSSLDDLEVDDDEISQLRHRARPDRQARTQREITRIREIMRERRLLRTRWIGPWTIIGGTVLVSLLGGFAFRYATGML